jgi:hypothetical protein
MCTTCPAWRHPRRSGRRSGSARGLGAEVARAVKGDAVDQACLDFAGNDGGNALQVGITNEDRSGAVYVVHVSQIVGTAGRDGHLRSGLGNDLNVPPQALAGEARIVPPFLLSDPR